MKTIAWGTIVWASVLAFASGCGSNSGEDSSVGASFQRGGRLSASAAQGLVSQISERFGVGFSAPGVTGKAPVSVTAQGSDSWLSSDVASKVPGLFGMGRGASVDVHLSNRLDGVLSLRDISRDVGISVRMVGVPSAEAAHAGDVLVYAQGKPGADILLVVPRRDGFEDWVVRSRLGQRPARLVYQVRMSGQVAAVRQVADTVEWLDSRGVPRVRLSPPWVKDAAGRVRLGHVSVTGCVVDQSPAAPWGRALRGPGSRTCRVQVTWREDGLTAPILIDPAWTSATHMGSTRYNHCAAKLKNGKVLVTGGHGSGVRSSAELFDPSTKTWASTASMHDPRELHTCTVLPNGQVLVAGGQNAAPLSSAELYDASSGLWTVTGSMHTARVNQGSVPLVSGEVLVAGGKDASGPLNSTELYDPVAHTWALTGTMKSPRFSHTLTALPDGLVLAAGGESTQVLSSTEWYSRTLEMWTSAPPMASPRSEHAALLLGNGRVLVAGGWSSGALASAEIYNPTSRTWATTTSMHQARHRATLTAYGASYVLAAGGSNTGAYDSAELFNFNAETWELAGKLGVGRGQHVAVELDASHVLVAGGRAPSGPINSVEIFSAQANGASCTQTGECSSHFCVDGVCCESACTNACMACSAALKGQGTDGACEVVKDGLDPKNDCAVVGSGPCRTPGTCNGSGVCASRQGFQCSDTSCIDNHTQNNIGVCDANQQCQVQGTKDCSPYSCKLGTCLHDCLVADDCIPTSNCVQSHCVQPGSNGARCQGAGDCSSGHCVDGVCCDKACNGTCEACVAVKKASGPDGTCGAAKFGSPCGATSCAQNKVTGMLCNSTGTCMSQTASCEPFTHCQDAKACPLTCSKDTDCVTGRFCHNGACDLPLAIGAPCSANNNCQTGYCVDHVCCSSSCGGDNPNDCKACSEAMGAKADGSCTSLNATPCSGGVCNFGICKAVPDAGTDAAPDAPMDTGSDAVSDTGTDVVTDAPTDALTDSQQTDVAQDVTDSGQQDAPETDAGQDSATADSASGGGGHTSYDAGPDAPSSATDTYESSDSCTCAVGPGARERPSRVPFVVLLAWAGVVLAEARRAASSRRTSRL